MQALVVRYKPHGSVDRVNRLVIPSRKLIITPDMQARRGQITSGDPVGPPFEVDAAFVAAAERMVSGHEEMQRRMNARSYESVKRRLRL